MFASSVVSYPFSSSESTLAPLRNNKVSSSWHPELGGALARPSLHQLGGKSVPKIVGWGWLWWGGRVPKLTLEVQIPEQATKQVSHLAAR